MRSVKKMPEFWERRFLPLELGACVVAIVTLITWSEYFGGYAWIATVLDGNRGAVYGTLASILGALLGFTITTVSVVIAFSTERSLKRLRASNQYAMLWNVLTSTIRWLGVATIGCLVALIVDRDKKPEPWALYLCVFSVLVSVARLWRTAWILENVIRIIIHQTSTKES
ncbi:MAG TPA: hypothetical protein VH583_09185 [Vicinamibacterales bacterium]|jgi:hypothetical protein